MDIKYIYIYIQMEFFSCIKLICCQNSVVSFFTWNAFVLSIFFKALVSCVAHNTICESRSKNGY